MLAATGAGAYVLGPGHTDAAARTPAASPSTSDASAPAAPIAQSECVTANTYLQTSRALTAAMTAGDPKAFMALAGSAQARSAMSRWWTNVHALGFTTGGVSREASLAQGAKPSSRALYSIGWHSSVDASSPTVADPAKSAPDSGRTMYALGSSIRWDGQRCQVSITKWAGRSNAPWDQPQLLYVKRTAHTIVAGEKRNRAAVDRAAGLAEVAYTWLHGFLKANRHEDYLRTSGFMVFVPTTGRQGVTWFRENVDNGVLDDPASVAGLTMVLDAVSPDIPPAPRGSGPQFPFSATGVSRVLLLPLATRGTILRYQQGVMVHEFTHAVFSTLVPWAADPKMAATMEGAASFVEASFRASPGSFTGRPMPVLLNGIRPFRSRFTGKLPSAGQLYGNANYADFYYRVSASTYAFVAKTRGTAAALETIRLAHQAGRSPFAAVVQKRSGTKVFFENPSKVQRGWAAWMRQQL